MSKHGRCARRRSSLRTFVYVRTKYLRYMLPHNTLQENVFVESKNIQNATWPCAADANVNICQPTEHTWNIFITMVELILMEILHEKTSLWLAFSQCIIFFVWTWEPFSFAHKFELSSPHNLQTLQSGGYACTRSKCTNCILFNR